MKAAYEAGLSCPLIAEVWQGVGFGHDGVHKRLRAAGVTMRTPGNKPRPSADVIDLHRKVAQQELARRDTGTKPRVRASEGMIQAYKAGLSMQTIGDLWNMTKGAIWVRLENPGVTRRSVQDANRSSRPRPTAATIAHYRRVAAAELVAEKHQRPSDTQPG